MKARSEVLTLKTKNSTYEVEVDEEGGRIRRVSGVNPPTDQFSPDGEWKSFEDIMIGSAIYIHWPDGNYTITSAVTK